MPNLNFSSFVIFTKDIKKSKKFYIEILNQEIEMDFGRNIGFKSKLALWDKDYAEQTVFGDTDEVKKQNIASQPTEIYFETDAVDAMFEKITKENLEIIHPIKEQPWKQRVFRFFDPDKYIIEVAETMPNVVKRLAKQNLEIEEINKQTMMPVEIIQTILNKE